MERQPEEKLQKPVEIIELFYDLIFVFCISRLTELLEPMTESFTDFSLLPMYFLTFLALLQIWIFTMFLMNRYGCRHVMDYICIFVNMFFIYIMADGISSDWESSFTRFSIAWALILVNLAVQFAYRFKAHDYTDDTDKDIIRRYVEVLLGIAVLVLMCIPIFRATGHALIILPIAFGGMLSLGSNRLYSRRAIDFGHLTERVSLLVVITFGEMVVGIAQYFHSSSDLYYAVCVFLIVAGLFLIYLFDFYNFLDRSKDTNGLLYIMMNLPLIFSLNNFTVALKCMPASPAGIVPKTVYLTISLAVYIASFYLLAFFHKPEFLGAAEKRKMFIVTPVLFATFCALLYVTHFDPKVSVALTVVLIYLILLVFVSMFRDHATESRL